MVKEIANALQRQGASVAHLKAGIDERPDLLVGLGGKNFLLKVKQGDERPVQEKFFGEWRGEVVEVATIDEAKAAIGLLAWGTYA